MGQNVVVLILLTSYHTYKMVFVSCFRSLEASLRSWSKLILGFHVYKEVWEPIIGEYSQCFLDNTNLYEPFAWRETAAVRRPACVNHAYQYYLPLPSYPILMALLSKMSQFIIFVHFAGHPRNPQKFIDPHENYQP